MYKAQIFAMNELRFAPSIWRRNRTRNLLIRDRLQGSEMRAGRGVIGFKFSQGNLGWVEPLKVRNLDSQL